MGDDNKDLMYPTTSWMAEKYNKFNNEIFEGRLGDCEFGLLMKGKGSQGGRLGEFGLQNKSLRVDYISRRIFVPRGFVERLYINQENFVELCSPIIRLNGHYQATEEAWENTLVHEMCHYYQYMYGKCPKQAHGPEFRQIAEYVSVESVGRFSVQRLASAEEMKSYKLDDEMQARKDKRVENKKSKAIAVFVFKKDGRVELTMLSRSSVDILRKIFTYYEEHGNDVLEMITSTDPRLIDLIYQSGFRKIFRTWRYWDVRNRSFVNNLNAYDTEVWINNLNENVFMKNKKPINEERVNSIIQETIEEYVNSFDNNTEDKNSIRIGDLDLGAVSPLEVIKK